MSHLAPKVIPETSNSRLQTGFFPAQFPLAMQVLVLLPIKFLPFVQVNMAVAPTSRFPASTIKCSLTSGTGQVISTQSGDSCPQVPSSEHNLLETPSSLKFEKHS